MPKEPSKRDQLKEQIGIQEQCVNRLRSEADPKHTAAMIEARRQKIRVLEDEIAAIQLKHEEAPAKLEGARKRLQGLKQELAQHDARHQVSQLDKLAKDLSKLSPEELQKLLAQLGDNQ